MALLRQFRKFSTKIYILGNDIVFNVAFSECDCGYVEECPWSWENMLKYLGIKSQDDAANFQMVQGEKMYT